MNKSLLVLPICILLILFPHLPAWSADKIQGDISPLEEFNISKERQKKEAEKYPTSYVKMPYAGINIILNDFKEIEVIGVAKGLPADVAGIQVDDIVIKMDGKVIKNRYQAFKIYERKSPGDSMEVEIKRNGKAVRKKIQLETIDMPYDLYVMGELISKEIPVRLAVVAGDVNFKYVFSPGIVS